jgi:hypothetical protein
MTLKNAKRRATNLGYEIELGGRMRKYRFRKVGSSQWKEVDDLNALLIFIGDTTCPV